MGMAAALSMCTDSGNLARELTTRLIQKSWVRITDHGIADQVIENAHATAVEFFSQPSARKREVDIRRSSNHRGYVDLNEKGDYGDEGGIRRYEAFDAGRDLRPDHPAVLAQTPLLGPNQWPDIGGFATANRRLFEALDRTTRYLLDHLELGLGMRRGTIGSYRYEPLSQMRYLNYQPPPPNAPPHAAMGAHTDYEFLTAIIDWPYPGSAIEIANNGEWEQVSPQPRSLLVMAGDLLETVSNGQISAAYHRVPEIPGQRFSIPFFAGADYAAVVEPASELIGPEGPQRDPIPAGEHLLTQLLRDFPYLRKYVTISLTDDTAPADRARMSEFELRRSKELQT